MSVTKKDVEHIAGLARLKLNEREKEKYSKELSEILDYMEKLNKVDVKNIEPTDQATGLTNVFRPDQNPHEINPEKIKKIIGQAPQRKDNFIKTKPVLEK